jgi:diguanylate cyclase (GGDEF)-like protein
MARVAWRGYASLLLVLALIVGGGLVGARAAQAATDRALDVHRSDRDAVRAVVARLASGYVAATFASLSVHAQTGAFSLRPGDPRDRALLRRMVDGSLFFDQGAVLTDLTGTPLTRYEPAGALPGIDDPGYRPLIDALMAGRPGLSSLMRSGDRRLVAYALPVTTGGVPRGLLVGYVRFDADGPSKQFLDGLPLGPRARLLVVDSGGVVTAANRTADIGAASPAVEAFRSAAAGRSGLTTDTRDGVEYLDAYSPIGHGGWSVVVEEPSADFLGPIRAQGTTVQLALLVLLVVAAGMVSVLHHRRQAALHQLAEQALRDPLTGLPNRILFQSRLDAVATPSAATPAPAALLFCDLDGFKQVNDGYGHEAGDRLLMVVAERLTASVRDDDVVARIGGDEFTVLLSGGSASTAELVARAEEVAERVGRALREPVDLGLGRPPVGIGVSIGIAVLDPTVVDGDAEALDGPGLLRAADAAMYLAKARGGGSAFATVP